MAAGLLVATFGAAAASCETADKEAPDGRLIVMFGLNGKLAQLAPASGFFFYEFQTQSDTHELHRSGKVLAVLHKTIPVVTMIFADGEKAGRYIYTCDSLINVQK